MGGRLRDYSGGVVLVKEKLKELQELTKCSIYIKYNEHKDYYETVQKHYFNPDGPGVMPDIVGTLDLLSDNFWTLQVYPNTPIAFYWGIANDLDELIQWAIDAIKEDRHGRGA